MTEQHPEHLHHTTSELLQSRYGRRMTTVFAWLVASILSLVFVIPYIMEFIHQRIPVYSDPVDVDSWCTGGFVFFTGSTTKEGQFTVDIQDGPGYLVIEYPHNGLYVQDVRALIGDMRKEVITQPLYESGETFMTGPFQFPKPEADQFRVWIVLPGIRFGFHRTKEWLGPFQITNPCPTENNGVDNP